MSKIDSTFQNLTQLILTQGEEYENKNRGVKRLQIPSYTLRHSFADGFPALSLKELKFRDVVGELLWFLSGDNDVTYLNANGIKIWNKDAYNWFVKNYKYDHPQEEELMTFQEFSKIGKGSVGQNYSVQWRNFNGKTDQITNLIQGMRADIMSSRLKVNAWNPSELDETALPPCHSEFQVIGVPLGDDQFGFELHWNQRSVDVFLGLPYNIASYALLAKILEHITGFKALAIEGTLKCVHFYDNQYEAARELTRRNPWSHDNCQLKVGFTIHGKRLNFDTIDQYLSYFDIDDFNLDGYTSDEAIKVKMLAPNKL